MTPGQTRVLVLLIVLMALEIVVHPGIYAWQKSYISQLQAGLSGGAKK